MVKVSCERCLRWWGLDDVKDSEMLIPTSNNLFMVVENHEKKCKGL